MPGSESRSRPHTNRDIASRVAGSNSVGSERPASESSDRPSTLSYPFVWNAPGRRWRCRPAPEGASPSAFHNATGSPAEQRNPRPGYLTDPLDGAPLHPRGAYDVVARRRADNGGRVHPELDRRLLRSTNISIRDKLSGQAGKCPRPPHRLLAPGRSRGFPGSAGPARGRSTRRRRHRIRSNRVYRVQGGHP